MLIEKGQALDIIRERSGMFAHVLNIMVLVLIPMIIIHVNENAFSLSELNEKRGIIPAIIKRISYFSFYIYF